MIIEETLRQRYEGVKNEAGVWITPAFPKLIYVLEEDNVDEGAEYFSLPQLAAQCTAKRMVPDYISEKKMREFKLSKGETEGNGDCYTCMGTAKRMVPDYISEKKMREFKLSKGETEGNGDCYTCMGCRSFLTPDRTGNGYDNVARAKNYEPGKPKYYGRFNQGVVTINLPDVALSSQRDMDKFWEIFDERLELCHRALRCRHERLLGTLSDAAPILWQYGALARLEKGEKIDKLLFGGYSTIMDKFWEIFDERLELCHRALRCRHERLLGTLSDAAPILWQYGALARLEKGEKIDKLLFGGYSTISLGYAGLYECVKYMTGASHTDERGTPFAMAVMQRMNDKCNEWKVAEDIDYSIYGTPLESTTYKFSKCLQRRFGIIPGVTDKGYITNSYHVHVSEEIDAFDKLKFESQFQRLSPGGAISYVEVPNMQDNLKAVIRVMQYIYDNIMYAELNTKSDYCQECGYDGEIKIVEDDGKLVWECPHCGTLQLLW